MLSFCGIDVSKDRLDVMVLPYTRVVSRLFRTFGLAERRPALAYAVMAPLIC
jgi:hypothetical protein